MKKVLFATTALALSAGVAAAEVALSGDARMGVVYDGENADFSSRARVKFTLSGETDGGLAFGASFRAHDSDEAEAGTTDGTVFISGAFGKLEMGDIDGAAEQAIGDLSGVGLTGLGDLNETIYLSHPIAPQTTALGDEGDPGLLYSYSAGDLSFYASLMDGQDSDITAPATTPDRDSTEWSLGLGYSFGDYSVAIGYESSEAGGTATDDATHVLVAGSATFGDATVKAIYGAGSDVGAFGGDFDQFGISLDYAFGATTVTAFAREVDPDVGASSTYIGVGASYDLGGGASLVGGIVDNDVDTVADFGVSFKF